MKLAKTRYKRCYRLKGTWKVSRTQELRALHGLNAEEELAALLTLNLLDIAENV